MADSPAPGESLVKKEADLPANDPIVSSSTSGWMLMSALLLTISIAWALYDEAFGQRPWKGMQREFVSRYTSYLDRIKGNAGKTEAELKESPEYQQLDAEARLTETIGRRKFRALRQRRPEPKPHRAGIQVHRRVAPVHLPGLELHQRPAVVEAGHIIVHEADLRRIAQAEVLILGRDLHAA